MSNRGPIIFGIVLVVIVAAAASWIYFLKPAQGLAINLTLAANPTTPFVGDPFDLSVAVTNDGAQPMQNAKVEVDLPAGVVAANSGQQFASQSVGAVSAGGVSHQDFEIVATGGANTVAHLTAKVTYNISGSNQPFTSTQTIDIPVGQPAVSASINAPANVFSGQNFPVTVSYVNNTDHAVSGMTLAMQYPVASGGGDTSGGSPPFSFVSASSSLAASGNSAWNLGTIPANGHGSITITGNIVGANNSSYPIGATIAETINNKSVTVVNPATSIVLASSPLTFTIAVNNAQNYISRTGDSLNYVITFTNNASVAFQNIAVSAQLSGAMFDFSSLTSNGSFNSVNDVITWNGAASPQLLSLAPGQTGSVTFFIRTKSAFPIRLLSNKNYSVSVAARLQSPTVPPNTQANATIAVTNITTKLGGSITLAEEAFHKEPTAGITNSGPYPPRVNKATQYTIHWLLTNYATDAENVTISAYLQSGTTCTGKSLAAASTTFACNAANGEVTWTIPVVPATTGIADKPLEAVFQVSNTPAINQVGQTPTLIGPTTLTATDGFTGAAMQSSVGPATTAVPNDTSVGTNQRGVQN